MFNGLAKPAASQGKLAYKRKEKNACNKMGWGRRKQVFLFLDNQQVKGNLNRFTSAYERKN
ncbi:hypothetical protein [Sunxiuqinia rutila]|uniref:hypothetical protein n=1 Tax=Sunxiuqinia rutila TaxID=1397841 RepID=UPI003D361D5C